MPSLSIPRKRSQSLQYRQQIGRPCAAFFCFLVISLTALFSHISPVLSAGSNPGKADCERISGLKTGHWKDSERRAWIEICRGRAINFNDLLDARPDPNNPDDSRWDKHRRLDPEFLRDILVDERFRSRLGERQKINIIGAYFPTGIDLKGASIRHPLRIHRSLIKRSVEMERLVTSERLSFTRVNVTGDFDLDSATSGSDVIIGNGNFKHLRLRRAEIGGDLDLRDSKFSGRVEMDSLSTQGDLRMRKANFEKVSLREARISGRISMKSSIINRRLDMKQAIIQGNVVMKSAELCTVARLKNVKVGADLDIRVSSLGKFDLTGAKVEDALIVGVSGGTNNWFTRCRDQNDSEVPARLILQNATVGQLKDTKDVWRDDLEREFDGFRYSRLSEHDRGSNWFIRWLALDKTYTRQPYIQLARVMEEYGRDDMASDIRFARWERKRSESSPWGFRWWLLTALRYTMGYGQGWGNLLALVWIAGFSVVGTIVLRVAREVGKDGKALGFWYSLDMLLPVVQLHGLHYETHLTTAAKYYFMVHRLLGYILLFFVVTGLTTVLTDIIG